MKKQTEKSRWAKIAGLKEVKAPTKSKNKKQINESVVGIGAVNPIFAVREPQAYETAFEHYLSERYDSKKENVKENLDDLPDTGSDVRDRTGNVRLDSKLNLTDDSEMVSRIEGLANVRDLGTMKDVLRILTAEWMQEGFEKEDIQDYITDFINKI